MNVKFYETDALHATLQTDGTQEGGYAIATNIRKHGTAVSVDYYWKIQCSNPNTSTHLHEGVKTDTGYDGPVPNEDFAFGFDFTVPAGKTLALDSVFFNLLVEQNASTNIRIMKGSEEVFNSGWSYAANGYNSHKTTEGQWVYGWCASVNKTGWNAFYGDDHEKLFATQTVKDGDLTLAAGDYRLLISVDWNNENAKALSFDEVTITGTISAATAINSITTEKVVKNGVMYNIAGQRISTPVRGQIYIMNGKKYIAK